MLTLMTSLKMSLFNKDSNFDIQLRLGEQAEQLLHDRFQNAKFELKTEVSQWERTGNLCIEYEYRGRPSGIAATQADFWIHELTKQGKTVLYLLMPTWKLKAICRKAWLEGLYIEGIGDNGYSKAILLPINRIADML